MPKRKIIAVIGSASTTSKLAELAYSLGKEIIDKGFRLANGGMFGVMEASAKGARNSSLYQEGDIIGILPGYNSSEGNPYLDIPIPTGIGVARNAVLMSMCDAVIAVGGGAGTLSEIALAWQLRKMIICIGEEGWHTKLKSLEIDHRRDDSIIIANSVAEAVELVINYAPRYQASFKGIQKKNPTLYTAREYIKNTFGSRQLSHVGTGSEGYIFRDSKRVYKYFHSAKDQRQLYWMLLALSEKVAESKDSEFFDFQVKFSDRHLITFYNDFNSTPYKGGEEEKVVGFLKAIQRLGWVMNNFKADNFRITSDGDIVCIDLGRSFYPKSETLFKQMCMRAFLTIHFPFHPRIKEFYSYTNSNPDFQIITEIGEDSDGFLDRFTQFYNKIVSTL